MTTTATSCARRGCRRTTTDASGRCHHHRGADLGAGRPPLRIPAPSRAGAGRSPQLDSCELALASVMRPRAGAAITALDPGASILTPTAAPEGFEAAMFLTSRGGEVLWAVAPSEDVDPASGAHLVKVTVRESASVSNALVHPVRATDLLVEAIARSHPAAPAWAQVLQRDQGEGALVDEKTFTYALALGAHALAGRDVVAVLAGRRAQGDLERYRDLEWEVEHGGEREDEEEEERNEDKGLDREALVFERDQALADYRQAATDVGYSPAQVDALAGLG